MSAFHKVDFIGSLGPNINIISVGIRNTREQKRAYFNIKLNLPPHTHTHTHTHTMHILLVVTGGGGCHQRPAANSRYVTELESRNGRNILLQNSTKYTCIHISLLRV